MALVVENPPVSSPGDTKDVGSIPGSGRSFLGYHVRTSCKVSHQEDPALRWSGAPVWRFPLPGELRLALFADSCLPFRATQGACSMPAGTPRSWAPPCGDFSGSPAGWLPQRLHPSHHTGLWCAPPAWPRGQRWDSNHMPTSPHGALPTPHTFSDQMPPLRGEHSTFSAVSANAGNSLIPKYSGKHEDDYRQAHLIPMTEWRQTPPPRLTWKQTAGRKCRLQSHTPDMCPSRIQISSPPACERSETQCAPSGKWQGTEGPSSRPWDGSLHPRRSPRCSGLEHPPCSVLLSQKGLFPLKPVGPTRSEHTEHISTAPLYVRVP